MKHFNLFYIQRVLLKLGVMIKQLFVGICVSILLIGCSPKCEETVCPELPPTINLKDCSVQLQNLVQNDKSHIRGLQAGNPLKVVNEKEEDFVDKTTFYTNYTPDLTIDYWADIEYHFTEGNIIDKVVTEVIPGGLDKAENAILVDSLYFELRAYLSGKYGNSVTNTDYTLVWNKVDTKDNSVTIFTLDYNFPDEDFSIQTDTETGLNDTIINPPTVKYVVKYIQ